MESYEQKYKAALEWMQGMYGGLHGKTKEEAEKYFPELAESEDERIRKAIIATIHLYYGEPLEDEAKDMIAWLEKQGEQETDEWKEGNIIRHGGILALVIRGRRVMKSNGDIFTVQYPDEWVKAAPKEIEHFLNEFEKQGEQKLVVIIPKFRVGDEIKTSNEESLTITKIDENGYWSEDLFICDFDEECTWDLVGQKPADKIKPKFKVDDFIVNDYCFGKVIEITNDAYLLDTGQGIPFSCEHNAHLWTIKDAKDGDVLACKIDGDSYILIYKQIKDGWIETYGHYYDAVNRFCVPSQLFCRDYKGTFYPATKEQRDTLMKAMADAGYTFDFDKKELKKNDTILDLLQKMPSCITVDGICYHFMLRKTIIYYTAFYEGEGEEGKGKTIFLITGDLVDILNEILRKLKEGGLLE